MPIQTPDITSTFTTPKTVKPEQALSAHNDYFFPLLTTIQGDKRYKDRLDTYCRESLRELINQSSDPKAYRLSHLMPFMKVLIHTLAYIISRPLEYRYIAISRDKNKYGAKAQPPYDQLNHHRAMQVIELMTHGSHPMLSVHSVGYYDHQSRTGKNTKYEPDLALKDRLVQANLVFQNHPFPVTQKIKDIDPACFLKIKYSTSTEDESWLTRELDSDEIALASMSERLKRLKIGFKFDDYTAYKKNWCFRKRTHRITQRSINQLFRIFQDHDGTAGRLYGHWLQNCPSTLRPYVTFNSTPTVELDYASMQLFLLYGLCETTPPQGDLYTPINSYIDRDTYKLIFTITVGAKNQTEALKAIRQKFKEMSGCRADRAQERFDAFWDYHKAVKQLALQPEIWKELQTLDSLIMLKVLNQLVQKDITAIPIHDSVIVQAHHEQTLRQIMLDTLCEQFPTLETERDRLIG